MTYIILGIDLGLLIIYKIEVLKCLDFAAENCHSLLLLIFFSCHFTMDRDQDCHPLVVKVKRCIFEMAAVAAIDKK